MRTWLIPLALLVMLAAGAGGYLWYDGDLRDRLLGGDEPAPPPEPAVIPPPPGLDLPPLTTPDAVAKPLTPSSARPANAAEVASALEGMFDSPDLGRHVVARVEPLAGGKPLFTRGDGTVTPASTMKLLTSTAALAELGPDATFDTRVMPAKGKQGKTDPGRITLVGGGDPYLTSTPQPSDVYPERADVTTLAQRTARSLRAAGRERVSVSYDDSLFSSEGFSPDWEPGYPGDVAAPITALWVDRGTNPVGSGYSLDPARDAANVFVSALRAAGIEVEGEPSADAGTWARKADPLGQVTSAPLAGIVQHLLDVSDNQAAEVVAHQVGLAVSGDGSFAGGAAAVRQVLTRLDVPLDGARILDGSGLARGDLLQTRTLTAVVRLAAQPDRPDLRPVLEGLPVAGFTGSLEDRFDDGFAAARGRVRAKTGTLTGVHGLAGVIEDGSGHLYAFAFVADKVAAEPYLVGLLARREIDRAAAALGACTCG